MDLQLLTLMVTPAVLISAAGLLMLSTTNRYGRVIDRTREILHELERLVSSPPADSTADHERREAHLLRQMESLRERGRLLNHAMRALCFSVACYVLASLSIVVSYGLTHTVLAALVLTVVGLVGSLYGALCLTREADRSLAVTEREFSFVMSLRARGDHGSQRAG